jgi:OPA family glycerol-3-phosphate transporter-like MFS transporter
MEKRKARNAARRPFNVGIAALFLGYVGYYLCRQNLSSAAPLLVSNGALTPAEYGWIAASGTAIYAVGKVALSWVPAALRPRLSFLIGLLGVGAASVLIGSASFWSPLGFIGLGLFVLIWGVSSLFQSLGWGSILCLAAQWPAHVRRARLAILSLSYQLGGSICAAVCGALLGMGAGWQSLFFIPGLIAIGTALLVTKADTGSNNALTWRDEGLDNEPKWGLRELSELAWSKNFVLLIATIASTMATKEFFVVWTPTFLEASGAQHGAASFGLALLGIGGCFGSLLCAWVPSRLEKWAMASGLLGLSVSLFGGAQAESLFWKTAITFLAGFFVYIPITLISGVVSVRIGGKKRAAAVAGTLDALGYASAVFAAAAPGYVTGSAKWANLLEAFALLNLAVALGLGLFFHSKKPGYQEVDEIR